MIRNLRIISGICITSEPLPLQLLTKTGQVHLEETLQGSTRRHRSRLITVGLRDQGTFQGGNRKASGRRRVALIVRTPQSIQRFPLPDSLPGPANRARQRVWHPSRRRTQTRLLLNFQSRETKLWLCTTSPKLLCESSQRHFFSWGKWKSRPTAPVWEAGGGADGSFRWLGRKEGQRRQHRQDLDGRQKLYRRRERSRFASAHPRRSLWLCCSGLHVL